jgi:hypothetical protein
LTRLRRWRCSWSDISHDAARSHSTTSRGGRASASDDAATLHELGTQIRPVRLREWAGKHWVLRIDLDRIMHATKPTRTQVSLLAALDPYTMGFRRRARMLNHNLHDFVYDRSGNATSVALEDGGVAGVWDVSTRSEVRFFSFNTLTSAATDRIGSEFTRMGSFLTGMTLKVRWVDQMTPLTDRRAGWVLKPLHDA